MLHRTDAWKRDNWHRFPCVAHTGTPDSFGYARVLQPRHGVIVRRAHRLAWIDYHGCLPPADKPLILHLCNFASCIEPLHLYAGTHQDNMQDKVDANRQSYGVNHARAKLTDAQVIEIRQAYVWYGHPNQKELAAMYGVSHTEINGIINRKYWTHL